MGVLLLCVEAFGGGHCCLMEVHEKFYSVGVEDFFEVFGVVESDFSKVDFLGAPAVDLVPPFALSLFGESI